MASFQQFGKLFAEIQANNVARLAASVPSTPAKCASQPEEPTNVRLQKYYELHSETVKKERCQRLIRCLSALRKPESTDVILICDDREFYAHKNVLEASSPYFVTVFSTGLEDAKSRRITFKDMKPETLAILLDFIYLGDVSRIKSEEQVKAVLSGSHLLQLDELFNYCCGALEVAVSVKNFSNLWQIGLKYEHKSLTLKVMEYVQHHLAELSAEDEFLQLSVDQLQGLLQFLKGKATSFDEMLQVLVKCLIHDPEKREKLASELLSYIDVKLVSKKCVGSLLEDEQVMKSSVEIANRMNQLGVAVLLHGS